MDFQQVRIGQIVPFLLFFFYMASRIFVLEMHYADFQNNDSLVYRLYAFLTPSSADFSKRVLRSGDERVLISDSRDYYRIARNTVEYRQPYLYPEDPGKFIVQPGYSLFMATFFILNFNLKAFLYVQIVIVSLAVLALYFFLVYRANCKIGGLLFVLLMTFYLPLIWFETTPWSEPLFTSCLIFYLILVHEGFRRHAGVPLQLCILGLIGVLIGFASLIRPIVLMFPLFYLFLLFSYSLFLKDRKIFIWSCKVCAASIIGIIAFMGAWSYQIYKDTGHVLIGASSGSGSIYLGVNEDAYQAFKYSRVDSLYNINLERQKDGYFDAFRYVLNNPTSYLANVHVRFSRLWLNVDLNAKKQPSMQAMMIAFANMCLWLFALIGASVLIKRKQILELVIIGSFILYITLLHQFLHALFRYSIPGIYFLLTLASIGMAKLIPRDIASAASTSTRKAVQLKHAE